MSTSKMLVLKFSNEEVEVDGDTLFLDGKIQELDGLETSIWFPQELELTLCHTNLTISEWNGFLQMVLNCPLVMKNGFVSSEMN